MTTQRRPTEAVLDRVSEAGAVVPGLCRPGRQRPSVRAPAQDASRRSIATKPSPGSRSSRSPSIPGFLRDEWRLIVDARDVRDAATYRGLPRHGRRTRLTGDRRDALWMHLRSAPAPTSPPAASRPTPRPSTPPPPPSLAGAPRLLFDHVLVDEAQDLALAEAPDSSKARPCSGEINGLASRADIGQRIFRPPSAWVADYLPGRSRSLKVNYRTSPVRIPPPRRPPPPAAPARARRRRGGPHRRPVGLRRPRPARPRLPHAEAEIEGVAAWIGETLANGVRPEEIGVLVQLDRGLPAR